MYNYIIHNFAYYYKLSNFFLFLSNFTFYLKKYENNPSNYFLFLINFLVYTRTEIIQEKENTYMNIFYIWLYIIHIFIYLIIYRLFTRHIHTHTYAREVNREAIMFVYFEIVISTCLTHKPVPYRNFFYLFRFPLIVFHYRHLFFS